MKENLNKLLKNSYSPYSKVQVAAIVTLKNNKEFNGVNIENSAYPSGICAERAAIFAAISSGAKPGDFKSIDLISNLEQKLYPCMACRQVMAEFFDDDTKVRIWNKEGSIEHNFESLVPFVVTKGSFGWK